MVGDERKLKRCLDGVDVVMRFAASVPSFFFVDRLSPNAEEEYSRWRTLM